jgi:REP element-mobilizing transposase RayT
MIAFHGIFGAYGFWLPNDPRGSWSQWVGSWDLFRYGRANPVNARHSLAHVEHDRRARIEAKQALRFQPVTFTGEQALAIARGFATALELHGMQCYACAILPQHIHVVICCESMSPGQALGKLKRCAGDELIRRSVHPFQDQITRESKRPPMCFARRAWKVFLDREEDVRRSIAYVLLNPIKEGLCEQRWSFVTTPRF